MFDDMFSTTKPTVPGKREDVVTVRRGLLMDPANSGSVSIPAPAAVAQWPQAGGGPTHTVGNIAVSGLTPAWKASIGEGGGYRRKITAQPIVVPGQVVTMDSDGQVAAFELDSGRRLWRTDTQGEKDRSTNVGGGVSFADGVIYASTGRAELLALDAGSGTIRWRKPLGSPARSAPTIANGRLFVLTLDDRVQAFTAGTGEREWGYQAASAATTLLGQAAPAVSEGLVVCGFGSGDLVALRAESGALAWSDSLASSRGRTSLVDLSAIRALPVVDQGRVYAIGAGGLLVELDLRSGRRIWERDVGGIQTPWLAGDWLFVLTLEQMVAAIGRRDGRVRWLREMPRYENPEKKRDPLYWSGPVLAGGKLVVAGSDERAYSIDPADGKLLGQVDLPGAAAVTPIAASGTMFIVTDDGTLQAYR